MDVVLGTSAGICIKLYDDIIDGQINAPAWVRKSLEMAAIVIVITSCVYCPTSAMVIFVFLGTMALIDTQQEVMDDPLWWEVYATSALLLFLGNDKSIIDTGFALFIAATGIMFQVIENNVKALRTEFSLTKVLWRLVGGLFGFFAMYVGHMIAELLGFKFYPLVVMMWICGAAYALTGVLVVMMRKNNGSNETSVLRELLSELTQKRKATCLPTKRLCAWSEARWKDLVAAYAFLRRV